MRVHAEVDVVNRRLAAHSMRKTGKRCKSQLAIGRKPLAEGGSEVFLMLSNTANKAGVKYLIKDNIETIFTRMLKEGKATIRFLEPPHDLCIQCGDLLQLKAFLTMVKKVEAGGEVEKLGLSALQPASLKQIEGPKKRLSVLKRGDFPSAQGFPPSLTSLQVSGIRLARVDQRMLKLGHLVHLDLSNNEIAKLPDKWDLVPALREVNLSGNQLASLPRGFCCGPPAATLRLLNLAGNQLVLLPNYVCSLTGLITLNLARNKLKALPPSFAKFSQLKQLDASVNCLTVLPGGLARLHLDSIELTGNCFEPEPARVLRDKLEAVPSLLELVARSVKRRGVTVRPDDVTPQVLQYLDSGVSCLCLAPVWTSCVTALVTLDLHRVANTVSAGGLDALPTQVCLCSAACLARFSNNPYAS